MSEMLWSTFSLEFGISPPIKTVIKEFPLKGKNVAVLATCGGMYFSVFHSFVKWSLNRRGANVSGVYVVKVGGKSDEEIALQVKDHLKKMGLFPASNKNLKDR